LAFGALHDGSDLRAFQGGFRDDQQFGQRAKLRRFARQAPSAKKRPVSLRPFLAWSDFKSLISGLAALVILGGAPG
jgi:hypothetical protein